MHLQSNINARVYLEFISSKSIFVNSHLLQLAKSNNCSIKLFESI